MTVPGTRYPAPHMGMLIDPVEDAPVCFVAKNVGGITAFAGDGARLLFETSGTGGSYSTGVCFTNRGSTDSWFRQLGIGIVHSSKIEAGATGQLVWFGRITNANAYSAVGGVTIKPGMSLALVASSRADLAGQLEYSAISARVAYADNALALAPGTRRKIVAWVIPWRS